MVWVYTIGRDRDGCVEDQAPCEHPEGFDIDLPLDYEDMEESGYDCTESADAVVLVAAAVVAVAVLAVAIAVLAVAVATVPGPCPVLSVEHQY